MQAAPTEVTTGSRPWANPDPSPDGAWLTFYSRQKPEGHAYVARVDGSGLRQLTGDTFLDRVPRWEADRKSGDRTSRMCGKDERTPLTSIRHLGEGMIGPASGRLLTRARMPNVTLHVLGSLRTYCNGASQLSLSAQTVRAALEDLERSQSALYRNVCDETGQVRRHLNVFVNADNVRDLAGVDTPLKSGDVVSILPAVSGG